MTKSEREIHRFKMRLRRVRHRFWQYKIAWTRNVGLSGGVFFTLEHAGMVARVADAGVLSHWFVDDGSFFAHDDCAHAVELGLVSASEVVLHRIEVRASEAEIALRS